ncbi:MAG: HisA/HisF-related TIM barrel protein [Pseudomonadota bacterium]
MRRRPPRPRIIPTLLIDRSGALVKTVRFRRRTYLGDPVNAVRIFNLKEVDELILLDIDATRDGRPPNFERIEAIASEAFLPLAYGGGLRDLDAASRAFDCGVEKVVLTSCLTGGPWLIEAAAARYGSQAIVACLPVKAYWRRRRVHLPAGGAPMISDPAAAAKAAVDAGAGELLIYAVDRDGTYAGYDLPLLADIAAQVDAPVVACGGARGVEDFAAAVDQAGCAAAAAGSVFLFQAKGRGALISYPSREAVEAAWA